MTNKRISDLTAATTPLAGTELVPVWDGATTKQTTVAKILTPAAGNGIDFSANTGAAGMTSELLDWYEEGTWTPVVAGNTTAGVGTYTVQAGSYTRIGNRVFFNGWVDWTAHTGTGSTYVDGLPFTVANNNNAYGSVSVTTTAAIALTAGNILQARMSVNVKQFLLLQAPTGGGGAAVVPISATGGFMVSGQYYV